MPRARRGAPPPHAARAARRVLTAGPALPTRSPGPQEEWRATAAAARFLVRREVSADGAERIACVDPESESGGACEPFVAERLLSPPSDRWAAVLMRKLLLQMPYPIVDGFVMRSNRGIHCMGE